MITVTQENRQNFVIKESVLPPPTPMEYLLVSGPMGAFYTLDGQSAQILCQAVLESHLRDGKTEAQKSGDLTRVGGQA